MNLKKLDIRRKEYGIDEGLLVGVIIFDNQHSEITLRLDSEAINKIFAVCADQLIETSKEAANKLTCAVIEHQQEIERIGNTDANQSVNISS